MMNTATQSRRKNYGRSPPVRVKHFISCNFRDLVHLSTHLDGITTENYTAELAKKTEDRGDCCMMSICEWGYARLEYEDNASYFDDQDHMDHVGEFTFKVNETCLSSDHNIFMVAPQTEMLTTQAVFTSSLLIWNAEKSVYLYSSSKEARTKGEEKGHAKV